MIFLLWLTSFSMTLSRSIHVAANGLILFFLRLSNIKKAEHRRTDAFKLWCWRRLDFMLDCKEIQPVHPKGNQSCILIGRTDAEAETPILWPPDVKNLIIGKDLMLGKIEGKGEEGSRG